MSGRVVTVWFALVVTLTAAGCSGSAAPSTHAAELIEQFGVTADELVDIQVTAEEKGWTLEEALDRIGWHWGFAALVQELRENYPDDFAGAAIDGEVGARNVVIAFKWIVPAEVRDDPRLGHLDVEFREMTGISELETVSLAPGLYEAEVHYALLDAGFRNLVSVWNQNPGRIEVLVERRESDFGRSDDEIRALFPQLARADIVDVKFVEVLPGSVDE